MPANHHAFCRKLMVILNCSVSGAVGWNRVLIYGIFRCLEQLQDFWSVVEYLTYPFELLNISCMEKALFRLRKWVFSRLVSLMIIYSDEQILKSRFFILVWTLHWSGIVKGLILTSGYVKCSAAIGGVPTRSGDCTPVVLVRIQLDKPYLQRLVEVLQHYYLDRLRVAQGRNYVITMWNLPDKCG